MPGRAGELQKRCSDSSPTLTSWIERVIAAEGCETPLTRPESMFRSAREQCGACEPTYMTSVIVLTILSAGCIWDLETSAQSAWVFNGKWQVAGFSSLSRHMLTFSCCSSFNFMPGASATCRTFWYQRPKMMLDVSRGTLQ